MVLGWLKDDWEPCGMKIRSRPKVKRKTTLLKTTTPSIPAKNDLKTAAAGS
jgi:hypothetical protein